MAPSASVTPPTQEKGQQRIEAPATAQIARGKPPLSSLFWPLPSSASHAAWASVSRSIALDEGRKATEAWSMPAAAAERVGSVGARGRCAWEGAAARAWSEKEEEERETRDAGAECTARAAHELRLAQRRRAA